MPGKRYLLMTSQKNDVFAAIRDAGLAATDFEWIEVPDTNHTSEDVSVLIFKGMPYFFQFGIGSYRGTLCDATISPGRERRIEQYNARDWEGVVALVVEWLGYLKREHLAPDLWASAVAAGVPDLGAVSGLPAGPLSAAEAEGVAPLLAGLQERLLEAPHLSQSDRRYIGERFDDIKSRLTASDRRTLVLGVAGIVFTVLLGRPGGWPEMQGVLTALADFMRVVIASRLLPP